MGRNVIFTEKGVIDVEHTEESLDRKHKKGDKVKIKDLCEMYDRGEEKCFCSGDNKCNHHKWCNQVGIVEDTDEAGSNWQGIPKYGLRGLDNEWLGDFLENEIESYTGKK